MKLVPVFFKNAICLLMLYLELFRYYLFQINNERNYMNNKAT
jgi:hypothetical protein